jgi:hypothetical protein
MRCALRSGAFSAGWRRFYGDVTQTFRTYLPIADSISTYGSRRQEVLTRYREHRKSAGRFTRCGAPLSFSADKPSADCVIWDGLDGGARLAVALPLADLPRHFFLNLFRDESVQRHCEAWMDKRFVGVGFTEWMP